MTAESSPPNPTDPFDSLPPVDPPSARFIMQLFVIPFIVVLVLVFFLLVVYGLFGRIATGGRDAIEFVQAIRSQNENRRWRAAFELASLIHNEPKLANDAALLGELSTLLAEELAKPADKAKVEVAQYLALALGSFEILQGTHQQRTVDPLATLVRALAEGQPAPVRIAAVESLSRLAARSGGTLPNPDVVSAFIQASASADAAIRQRAAFALAVFDTPEVRKALADRLVDDDRLVRYNAGAALTRLDDPAALTVLREMLSTPDLEAAFAAELQDHHDETRRRLEAIQLEALLSLQHALDRRRFGLFESVRNDLQKLSSTGSPPVEIECKNLLKKRPVSQPE